MNRLKDKCVMITGATSGIGEACAEQFAEAGSNLLLIARRKDRLQAMCRRLTDSYAIRTRDVVLDVTDRERVTVSLDELPEEWQAVDILINNAGLARGFSRFHEIDLDDMEEMMDTNVKGLIYVSRKIIPGMVARGGGHIVNIGSIAGHDVYPKGNIYCATKHAVDALTKGMRMDLYDAPVRVSTVDPGLVETEFSMVRFRGDSDRASAVYRNMMPLSAADIADIVLFITSRPAHVQIGQVVVYPTDQASATIVNRRGD